MFEANYYSSTGIFWYSSRRRGFLVQQCMVTGIGKKKMANQNFFSVVVHLSVYWMHQTFFQNARILSLSGVFEDILISPASVFSNIAQLPIQQMYEYTLSRKLFCRVCVYNDNLTSRIFFPMLCIKEFLFLRNILLNSLGASIIYLQ